MSVPSSAFDYVGTGEKAGAKIHSASWGKFYSTHFVCAKIQACRLDSLIKISKIKLSLVVVGAPSYILTGTQTQNNYGTLDQAMDNYLYAKQDSIIVTAAGNRGAYGLNTVASPSISKNTIVGTQIFNSNICCLS